MRRIWNATKDAVNEFFEDDAMTLAAALAFYTALSLAPLLLIAVWGASLIWGRGAQDEAAARAAQVVGEQGAQIIRTVLDNASRPSEGRFAAIMGFGLLLFSASGVFAQLQYSLNQIWDVKARPDIGLKDWLCKRLWTLVMLLVIGAIFLASIIATRGAVSHAGPLQGPGPRVALVAAEHRPAARAVHPAVRDDLQDPAGRADRVARCVVRGHRHHHPVHDRAVPDRLVPGPRDRRLRFTGRLAP